MQVSQLMHSDISIRSGGLCHFGFRSCEAMRSARVVAAMAAKCRRGALRPNPSGRDAIGLDAASRASVGCRPIPTGETFF
jgi:hypothetical protein